MHHPMRFALVALALLALATPTASAITREIPVFLHDQGEDGTGRLHILPEEIRADVGDVLRLTVQNAGVTIHDLVVCGDALSPAATCSDRWGSAAPIQPGATATVEATVEKAGTFQYWCTIAGHKDGGMVGRLIVAGGAEEGSNGIPLGPLAALALAGAALAWRRRP